MPTVLGLDLARGRTGWVLLNRDTGQRPRLLASGVIDTPAHERVKESRGGHLTRQFVTLTTALWSLVEPEHHTDLVAYEYPSRPRHAHWGAPGQRQVTPGTEFNAMQSIGISEGWITAWHAIVCPQIPLLAVPVEDAKRYITGNPNAAKELVARLLRARFAIDDLVDKASDGTPLYDRSDAASVALFGLRHLLAQSEQARLPLRATRKKATP